MSSDFKFIFRNFLFIILLVGVWACDMNDDDATEDRMPTVDVKFTFSVDNKTVTFTDESIVFDGSINGCYWDFGDGTNSTDYNPTHTYADDGTYSVKLILTDNEWIAHEAIKTVVITQSIVFSVDVDFTFAVDKNNVQYYWYLKSSKRQGSKL